MWKFSWSWQVSSCLGPFPVLAQVAGPFSLYSLLSGCHSGLLPGPCLLDSCLGLMLGPLMNPTLFCGLNIAGCQWRQWWYLSPLTPRLACVVVFGMLPGSGREFLALSLGGSPGNGPPRDVSSSLLVSPSSVPGLSGMVSGKILLCTCRSFLGAYRSSILGHTLSLQWCT